MANILVIDDDLDLQSMLRLMLERGGHTVTTTGDGADGLLKAHDLKPDMVIIDVMMPGMHGYDVCRKLREDPVTKDMKILILTARTQPVDRQEAFDAQADDFVPKPIAPDELLKKVGALLSRRSGSRPEEMMMTLISLRGGVGVSSIAVNLALAMQTSGVSTCVVDLSPASGHIALQLRLQPKITWAAWLRTPDKVNLQELDNHLLKHESGLSVVAAPFIPELGLDIPGDVFAAMFKLLRHQFKFVIVDAPPVLNEAARVALELADEIGLVFTPQVASLQSTIALLRAFKKQLNISEEKVALICNQITPQASLSADVIEKALNRPLSIWIDYDDAQLAAFGQGVPLVLTQPDSPFATAIKQFV